MDTLRAMQITVPKDIGVQGKFPSGLLYNTKRKSMQSDNDEVVYEIPEYHSTKMTMDDIKKLAISLGLDLKTVAFVILLITLMPNSQYSTVNTFDDVLAYLEKQ